MPRLTDKNLGEACGNGDGTYNGLRLIRWLHEAATGKPMTDAEAKDLWAGAQVKAAERRNVRSAGA